MAKARMDFLWYKDGDEISLSENPEDVKKWREQGLITDDEVKPEVKSEEKPKLNLDLNRDGKVDKKDFSLAAKTLRKAKKKLGRR